MSQPPTLVAQPDWDRVRRNHSDDCYVRRNQLQLPYPNATLDFLHPRMPVLGLRLLPFGRKVLVDEVGWHNGD
jgi:hypothetical protein